MPIADNGTLTIPERFGPPGFIDRRRRDRLTEGMMENLAIKTPGPELEASGPSRGNQAEGRHGPRSRARPQGAGADQPDRRRRHAVQGVPPRQPFLQPLAASPLKAATDGGARIGAVGGAGSLRVAEGGPRLVDTPDFPDAYKPEALAHADVLDTLRAADTDADWYYVSPAAEFGAWAPGERTGTFRLGADALLTDADGKSFISGADYATAFVDEIDTASHRRARFTVSCRPSLTNPLTPTL